MDTSNDYDSDGNNIVPCPICLDNHCPSKEGGKCPDEDDFINPLTSNSPKAIEIIKQITNRMNGTL